MKYLKGILSLASVGLLFYVIENQRTQIKTLKEQVKEIPTLEKKIDSLTAAYSIEHFNENATDEKN